VAAAVVVISGSGCCFLGEIKVGVEMEMEMSRRKISCASSVAGLLALAWEIRLLHSLTRRSKRRTGSNSINSNLLSYTSTVSPVGAYPCHALAATGADGLRLGAARKMIFPTR
jgi:hypothetical protein